MTLESRISYPVNLIIRQGNRGVVLDLKGGGRVLVYL